MSLAWHIAWLGFHDSKKLPKLKSLIITGKTKRGQSVAEMEAVLRAINAAMGGNVV